MATTLPANFPYPATRDKEQNIKVRADHFDENMAFLISLIGNSLSRFGANNMQGNINANNHTFKNISTPTEAGDAVPKQYVDQLIQQIINRNPALTPGLIQIATQDEALAGAVTNKAVTPATLALVIAQAISSSTNQLPYGFLGGFDLSFSNNTQLQIGIGQCTDSTNTYNMVTNFIAEKDISTLWAPSDGQSTVVGGRPANVPFNLWSRYNIFAISTNPTPATHGTFTTIDLSSNVDNFKGVGDGFMKVVIDGVDHNLTGLDFSTVDTVEDIATIIRAALSDADVTMGDDNTIVFTSDATGSTSSVNIATISGASGTDITVGGLLDVSQGTVVNGTNYKYAEIDFGIDQGNNYSASNLLATTGTAYQAGFRNYRYIGYLVVGANNQIVSVQGANEETAFNRDRSFRVGTYADQMNIPDFTPGATNFYNTMPGYLFCSEQVSIGLVNGSYYAYWGSDGIRRFMLPDGQLYDKLYSNLGGVFGTISLTDNTSQTQVIARKLPGFYENAAFRRAFGTSQAAAIGTLQESAAPNITGSFGFLGGGNSYPYRSAVSGAFMIVETTAKGLSGSSSNNVQVVDRWQIDASRSNEAYGRNDADEVRPTNFAALGFVAY